MLSGDLSLPVWVALVLAVLAVTGGYAAVWALHDGLQSFARWVRRDRVIPLLGDDGRCAYCGLVGNMGAELEWDGAGFQCENRRRCEARQAQDEDELQAEADEEMAYFDGPESDPFSEDCADLGCVPDGPHFHGDQACDELPPERSATELGFTREPPTLAASAHQERVGRLGSGRADRRAWHKRRGPYASEVRYDQAAHDRQVLDAIMGVGPYAADDTYPGRGERLPLELSEDTGTWRLRVEEDRRAWCGRAGVDFEPVWGAR